mmetsp:Transcript_20666/g.43469  ORF Transcript_20666/g.43469 Transcript_20666/m.43469 type:complete len:81 (-) Transcript_20666:371-613(-)
MHDCHKIAWRNARFSNSGLFERPPVFLWNSHTNHDDSLHNNRNPLRSTDGFSGEDNGPATGDGYFGEYPSKKRILKEVPS